MDGALEPDNYNRVRYLFFKKKNHNTIQSQKFPPTGENDRPVRPGTMHSVDAKRFAHEEQEKQRNKRKQRLRYVDFSP